MYKFKIGDEVHTNEEYEKMAAEHNGLPSLKQYPLSKHGTVIDVKIYDLHKTTYDEKGFGRIYPNIVIGQVVAIKIDESGYWNQNYFDKV